MGYSPASAIPLNTFGAPTGNIAMASHKFTGLLDGSVAADSAGWDQLPTSTLQYAYVASGCLWTADAAGSTRNASMSAGTVVVAGLLYSVSSISGHSFAASSDTYVDINISAGAAVVNYTAVTNNSLSPALVSSGTVFNTVRIAVVTVGASNIAAQGNIGQGSPTAYVSTGATLGSSTVAAGSNGNNITATPLNVAAGASFSTGGGWAQVAHSTQTYTIQYTGVSSNTLTGVTVLSGTGTVSTGDTVTQVFPVGASDLLGNPVFPVMPYPRLVAYASFANTVTTTANNVSTPVPGLIAPFIVPAGPIRNVRISLNVPALLSSATAGTLLQAHAWIGNSVSGGTSVVNATPNVKVASDGDAIGATGVVALAAGSYTAQVSMQQGAAGTLTFGASYNSNTLAVDLI